MDNITFLEFEDLNKLDVLNTYGTLCSITDFNILLGGNIHKGLYTSDGINLYNRATVYYTKTDDLGNVLVSSEKFNSYDPLELFSSRPVIKYNCLDDYSSELILSRNGICEILYGYYPQMAVSKSLNENLERLYKSNNLVFTNNRYNASSEEEPNRYLEEYEYLGNRYVRFVVDKNSCKNNYALSNGVKPKEGNAIWIKVEPIRWLVDRESKTLISKKALFSNIIFDDKKYYGDFDNTIINKYLNNDFKNEISQGTGVFKRVRENVDLISLGETCSLGCTKLLRDTVPTSVAMMLGSSKVPNVLTKTIQDCSPTVYCINAKNIMVPIYTNDYQVLIRPVIRNCKNFDSLIQVDSDIEGFKEVTYGVFPQLKVDSKKQQELQEKFNSKKLVKMDCSYTFNNLKDDNNFYPCKYSCYMDLEDNNIYINLNHFFSKIDKGSLELVKGKALWVQVLPVKWLVLKNNMLISKYGLVSGIPLTQNCEHKDYDRTFVKKYLDEFMSKELFQEINLNKTVQINQSLNSYGLSYDSVSEEEIIRGCIESDIPVFLHGRSSEGKSARVKQIDPDLTIIYLRNSNEGTLCGKSVYNQETGELIDIKPTWLKKLESKCEREPDKIHILFFDEITNALPSIQGMAFNIVLDKEVNGIWKLPSNVRIVASGNEINDSLSANQLAEPLFNRFAHVYIETKVDQWLEWADKNNIHPAIYAFIAYKKKEALRSKYDGEKPNADPRKWEMASKMLYKTKNPEMLRSLIGNDITREFVAFCNQRVITLNDVLSGNYNEEDLNLNASEKYSTIIGLLGVSKEDYGIVKEFVSLFGSEFETIFDSLWSKDDPEKLEIVYEQSLKNKLTLSGGNYE